MNSPKNPTQADPFAAFASASAQIQSALQAERERSKRLEEQVVDARRRLAETLAEDRAQIQELSGAVATLRASNGQHVEHSRELEERVRVLHSRYNVQTDELQRYRAAWSEVLQREREAKNALLKSVEQEKRTETLQSQVDHLSQVLSEEQGKRERAERFAEAYQAELKHSLVRIHSAEAKFSELSKEHQALAQNRRHFQEEVAKVETQIRERAQWEVQRERERLRLEQERCRSELERMTLENERTLTEERERTRGELQRTVLAELELRVGAERQSLVSERARREGLESELKQAQAKLAQAQGRLAKKIAQGVRIFSSLRKSHRDERRVMTLERQRALAGAREAFEAQLDSLERVSSEQLAQLGRRATEEQNALRASLETRIAEQASSHAEREAQLASELTEKVKVRDSRLFALESALDLESDRSDRLEQALHSVRTEFEAALRELSLDVSRARALDPVRHLGRLKAKELAELRKKLDPRSPKTAAVLALAEGQLQNLEQLSAEFERRLRRLDERISESGPGRGSAGSPQVALEPGLRPSQTLDA